MTVRQCAVNTELTITITKALTHADQAKNVICFFFIVYYFLILQG